HRAYWLDELDRASDAIADAIGRRPTLFRPPMGYKNWYMGAAARERGYTVVTWSNRGLDGIPTTPDRIVRRGVGRAQAGEVGTPPGGRGPPGGEAPRGDERGAGARGRGPAAAGPALRGARPFPGYPGFRPRRIRVRRSQRSGSRRSTVRVMKYVTTASTMPTIT